MLAPTKTNLIDDAEIQLLQVVGSHAEQERESGIVTTHHFAPGIYLRELFVPKGCFAIGHEHKTEHYNIVLQGCLKVAMSDGTIKLAKSGDVIRSEPGIRKAVEALLDSRWLTVHPNPDDETDISKLEDQLTTKSQAWLEHEESLCLSGQSE